MDARRDSLALLLFLSAYSRRSMTSAYQTPQRPIGLVHPLAGRRVMSPCASPLLRAGLAFIFPGMVRVSCHGRRTRPCGPFSCAPRTGTRKQAGRSLKNTRPAKIAPQALPRPMKSSCPHRAGAGVAAAADARPADERRHGREARGPARNHAPCPGFVRLFHDLRSFHGRSQSRTAAPTKKGRSPKGLIPPKIAPKPAPDRCWLAVRPSLFRRPTPRGAGLSPSNSPNSLH
jgi:hypothetical protein